MTTAIDVYESLPSCERCGKRYTELNTYAFVGLFSGHVNDPICDACVEKGEHGGGQKLNLSRPEENADYRECCRCGGTIDVEYWPDPYAWEIAMDDTPVWECRACRKQSADDI